MSTQKRLLLMAASLIILFQANSQGVGIGVETPNPNAVLELVSPDNNQGLLVPKMTTAQRTASTFTNSLTQNENGLLVYDTDENAFYFWINSQWVSMQTAVNITAGEGIEITDGIISNVGDLDDENELQDISISGSQLTISGGSTIDLSPLDTDTKLTEAEVDAFVANNGYIDVESDPSVPANLKDGVDWNEIASIPADLTDGDNDTQLTEAEVDTFVGNNGFITEESDPSVPANLKDGLDWSEIASIPEDLADGVDNVLTETEVDAFTANNGYLIAADVAGYDTNASDDFDGDFNSLVNVPTGLADGDDVGITSEADPTVPANLKDGVDYSELTNTPTIPNAISELTNDSGFIDTETDPTVPANIKDGIIWSEIGNIPADIADGDDNTQLDESAVDAFVANNGYLTSEVDGDPNNEIQDLELVGNTLRITNNASATDINLAPFAGTNTDEQTLSLTGTDLTISGGNTIDVSSINTDTQLTSVEVETIVTNAGFLNAEVDGSISNETNTAFQVNAGNIEITDAAGTLTIPLLDVQDGTGTDDQVLSTSGAAGNITLEDGGTININVNDADADPTNEIELPATAVSGQVLKYDGTDWVAGSDNTGTGAPLLNDGELLLGNGASNSASGITGDLALSGNTFTIQNDAVTNAKIASGIDYGKLTNIPAGIADGIDNVDDADADPNNELVSAFEVNGANLELTDAGTTYQVPISSLGDGFEANTDDQDASEVLLSGSITNLAAGDVQAALQEHQLDIDALVSGGSDGVVSNVALNTTNLDFTATGGGFNGSVDLSSFATDTELAALDTDDADANPNNELVSAFEVNGANLELTDAGTTYQVPISSLGDGTGTDDQNASEVNVIDAGGNFTNTSVEGVLGEIDNRIDALVLAGGSDGNDFVTGGSLTGTELTLDVPNQTNPVIELAGLQDGTGTDDQALSTSGAAGNISLEDGGTININVNDADASPTNELVSAFEVNGVNLELTDAGTTYQVPISSLGDGIGTDDQALSTSGAAGNISLEDGGTININVNDADASPSNELVSAFEVNGVNLELTDAGTTYQVPISSLGDGIGTDDQALSTSGAAGNISLEDGGTININVNDADASPSNELVSAFEVNGVNLELTDAGTTYQVPISSLGDGIGTDDQALSTSGAAGNISLEDGGTININVDDADASPTNELVSAFEVNGVNLELTDAGTTYQVPISSLGDGTGTDDQNASEVNVIDAGGNFTNTSVEGVLGEIDNRIDALVLAGGSDGNDFVTGGSLTGTELTLDVPNQTNPVIELAGLQDGTGTDDQALSTSGAAGNISLEDGGTININVNDADASPTNELVSAFEVNGVNLELTDAGTTYQVPISSLGDGIGTDDQALSTSGAAGNISLEDGGTININVNDADASPSNELVSAFEVNGVNLELTDAGTTYQVPISSLGDGIGTDDQALSTSGAAGNISLEDGGTININVNDADASPSNELVSAFEVNGVNLELTDAGTTYQVPISSLGDGIGTDDQALSTSGAAGNISLEDGGTININVDDADASPTNELVSAFEVNGVNLELTDAGTTYQVPISSLGDGIGTDDQALSTSGAAGNISLEDGGTININVDDADASPTNELVSAFEVNGINLELTDAGTTYQVPISSLGDGIGTDDQALSTSGAAGNISLEDGGTININVNDADASPTNELVSTFEVNGANLELTDAGTTFQVPISSLGDGTGTDDQQLSFSAGNINLTGTNPSSIDVSAWDTDASDDFTFPADISLAESFEILRLRNTGAGSAARIDIVNDASTSAALVARTTGDGPVVNFDHSSADALDIIAEFRSEGNPVATIRDDGRISATSFIGDGSGLTNLPTFSGSWNDLIDVPASFSDDTDNDNQNLSFTDDPATINISGGTGIDVSGWDLDSGDDFFLPATEFLNTGATVLDLTNGGAGTVASFTSTSNNSLSKSLVVGHSGAGNVAEFTNSGDNTNPTLTVRSTISGAASIDANRGIIIGDITANSPEGAIRYSGGDFEGNIDGTLGGWVSLTSAGSSSPWNINGSDLFYNSGGVGIGTNTPSELFEVSGSDAVRIAGKIRNTNDQGDAILTLENDEDLGGYDLGIGGSANGSLANSFYLYDWGNDIQRVVMSPTEFRIFNPAGEEVITVDAIDDVTIGFDTEFGSDLYVNGTTFADAFVGDGSGLSNLPSSPWTLASSDVTYGTGDVGIGPVVGDPAAKLHIGDRRSSATASLVLIEEQRSESNASMTFQNTAAARQFTMGMDGNDSQKFKISASSSLGTSDIITVNSATNRVGIGTTGPTASLDVSEISSSSVQLNLSNTGSGDAALRFEGGSGGFAEYYSMGIDNSDGDKFKISNTTSVGASDRLTIDGSGNIGIGSTAPSAKLDIVGNTEVNGDLLFGSDLNSITFPAADGTNDPMINLFASGTNNGDRMIFAQSPSFPGYGLQYQDAGDKFVFLGNSIPALSVDLSSSGGNVGVGTSDPSAKLDVNGTLEVNGPIITPSSSSITSILSTTGYTLTPSSTTRIMRIQNPYLTGISVISGITPGVDGQELMLINVDESGANTIRFTTSDGTATPNAILIDSNTRTINAYDVVKFIYSSDIGAWLLVSVSSNTTTIIN